MGILGHWSQTQLYIRITAAGGGREVDLETHILGSDGFTDAFYQKFKGELTPICLLKVFLKIVEARTLPNSFYEASSTLKTTEKDTIKKENYRQGLL